MGDLFAPGYAATLVLLACRIAGMVLVAPVYSAKTVPVRVRTGALVLLTVLLAPSAHAALGGAVPEITPATFLTESVIGFAIGFGAAVLIGAAETAGDLMSTSIGLSGAALFDPLNGANSNVLAQLCQMFAVTVMLAVDGHLVMLDAVGESARAIPVGASVDVTVQSVPAEEYGKLRGRVKAVGRAAQSKQKVAGFLGDKELAARFTEDGPPVAVLVRLDRSATAKSGYAWTKQGPPFALESMTPAAGAFHLAEQRPIDWLLP